MKGKSDVAKAGITIAGIGVGGLLAWYLYNRYKSVGDLEQVEMTDDIEKEIQSVSIENIEAIARNEALSLQERLDKLEYALIQQSDAKNQTNQRIQELEQQKSELQQQINSFSSQLSTLKSKVSSAKTDLENAQNQYQSSKATYSSEANKLNSLLVEKDNVISEAEKIKKDPIWFLNPVKVTQVSVLGVRAGNLDTKISQQRGDVANAESDVFNKENSVNRENNEYNSALNQLNQFRDANINPLKEQITAINTEIQTRKIVLNEINKNITKVKSLQSELS